MLQSIHPFDQSIVGEFQEMDSSTIQKKLELAAIAYRIGKIHPLAIAVN